MICGVKPYPAYKDSGVPWLGQVPEHWEVRRQRNVAEMRVSNVDKHSKDGESPVRLCNYIDVYKNERITVGLSFMRATATPEEIERFRLKLGDVLITKDSETWDDIGVPSLVEYSATDLICGYHLALLRPRSTVTLGPFLLRALQSSGVSYQYHIGANGVTRFGLSHDAIKKILIPVPPISEQAEIARFLDHIDRRIGRYIRAKKKLIALLNEQKQAIIHRAVTRGLDPNVRFKPSGTEWLEDVPCHWDIVSLRRITLSRCDGPFGSALKSVHYSDRGIRVVRLQNIGNGEFKDSAPAFISQAHYESLGDHSVRAGDVLIAGLGDERHPTGRACVAPVGLGPAMVKADCFRFRLDPTKINADFAALQLSATAIHVSSAQSRGATRQRINLQSTAARLIALPSLVEQGAIVDHISAETAVTSTAIASVHHEIDLLHEYRTRLIADVVTGKLDVREAAARLPDEPEDGESAEPIEDTGVPTEEGAAEEDSEAVPEEELEEALA